MGESTRIAIVGLGEAGSLIGAGLSAAGAQVVGFDPFQSSAMTFDVASSLADAVHGADLVVSINSSTAAQKVAEEVAPLLAPDAIYADFNTGTPVLKRKVSEPIAKSSFVDVAVLKPVPGLAERVPLAAAGPAARRFVELVSPFGMVAEYVSETVGDAAARKLIRSILAKGMAAVVIDTLWAAESLQLQDWAYEEIFREFDSLSSDTAQRYISGTVQHVKRRQIEMHDVSEMLHESGYASPTVDGVSLTYARILNGAKVPFA